MGDIVDLRGQPIPTKDDTGWVTDLARFSENLVTEESIRKKYRLADAVWEKLADDDELVRAVEDEKLRRVRSGQQKRERAQQFAVKVPEVAASIAFDASANPRHRLDAGQLIDKLAGGPESANVDSTRFIITINMGDQVEHYDKSISINADDRDPSNDIDASVLAAIAMKKPTESGSGNAV